MNPEHIDRRRLKSDMKSVVRSAQVGARAMTALYWVFSRVSWIGTTMTMCMMQWKKVRNTDSSAFPTM